MFDVVCSRKASGPWETPGIIGAAVIGWEGPGCGIPAAAGCIVAALAVVAAAGVGDSPMTGADGLRFNMACQCCSRSLCFCIRLFLRSSWARSSEMSYQSDTNKLTLLHQPCIRLKTAQSNYN